MIGQSKTMTIPVRNVDVKPRTSKISMNAASLGSSSMNSPKSNGDLKDLIASTSSKIIGERTSKFL